MAQGREKETSRGQRRDLPDDPGQALESGEQGATGRSRGEIIEKDGSSPTSDAKRKPSQQTAGGEQHFESGRHEGTPD
jgi:hypothetical protein